MLLLGEKTKRWRVIRYTKWDVRKQVICCNELLRVRSLASAASEVLRAREEAAISMIFDDT